LRAEVLSNLPRFEQTVDSVVARFTDAALSEIQGPRGEARRLRAIAGVHMAMVEGIAVAAGARLTRLTPLLS
jgi:hypothetical protein